MSSKIAIDPKEFIERWRAVLLWLFLNQRSRWLTMITEASVSIKLNAAYLPGQSQFLLFQRSAIEQIPLAANLQVISHEFGHAVFDYVLFSRIGQIMRMAGLKMNTH